MSTPPTEPELLTLPEVARQLLCSVRTVRRLIDDAALEVLQLRGRGGALLITRRSIDRHVRRQIREYQLDNGAHEKK